ncbi:MAG: glycosyltransferase [Cytophagales bacterium]|nr:glycosyltransferase [Cytophagales bacterium]
MSLKLSIIIPVYNRPDELNELLDTLTAQSRKPDEVIVVEDGSTISSKSITKSFEQSLPIRYLEKENEGQGFARNFGYQHATGDFLIVFDSDCLIPSNYLQVVADFLTASEVDAYGGPDAAHPDFTVTQKAISHSMTSVFTTGGIRGRKKHVGEYHPRSFNMGISKRTYEATQGYIIPFMGEDLEFSTRIIKHGFKTALIPEAFVYHKRRTDLKKFYQQLKYFGRARINLTRFHPEQIKIIHLFPLIFSLGLVASLLLSFLWPVLGLPLIATYGFYFSLIAVESLIVNRSLAVAFLTPIAAFLQMFGYGYGLTYEWIRKLRGIDPNTKYIELY